MGIQLSGSTWTQQGSKLTNGSAFFGGAVALSADGDTALIRDLPVAQGAWVYTRSGSTWTQQTEKLTYAGEGCDVALSGDASTALDGTAVFVSPHK
jgi:hypothetical protein